MSWVSNTLLSDTAQFGRQFGQLEVDTASAQGAVAPMRVPDQFDGRATWALYLPPVKDQCSCGGCWAFATTACLAARINIWTTNRVHVDLSPAKLIYCNWGADEEYALVKRAFDRGLDFADLTADIAASAARVGCSGETLLGAWQFLYRYGGTTEACHPYRSDALDLCATAPGQALPSCTAISGPNMSTCVDGSPEKRYRAGGFYMVAGPLHVGEAGDASEAPEGANKPPANNAPGNQGNRWDNGSGYDNSGGGSQNGSNSGGGSQNGKNSGTRGKDSGGGDGDKDTPRAPSPEHTRRHLADNQRRIKQEIWKYGPVTTGMEVYADLFTWDGAGVYQWDGAAPLSGGHAVVVTGWGTLGGTPYWQVMNSWGAAWGDGGYFRILRGANHCGVETNVIAGYPDMPLSDRFLLQPRLRTPEDLFLRHVWQYDASGYDLADIHRMLLDDTRDVPVAPVYTASMVPDYRTMIAGQPRGITYPYASTRTRLGLLLFVVLVAALLTALAWYRGGQ